MKKEENKLFKYLKEYFTVYLPKQRNCSSHTIIACQQTWNMFLKYIRDSLNVKLEKISINDITNQCLTDFLNKMENEKNWSVSTRNHRLSCIRSFFKYLANVEPVLVVYYEQLNGIPLKKDIDKSHMMEFMSPEAIKILLQQPDVSSNFLVLHIWYFATKKVQKEEKIKV